MAHGQRLPEFGADGVLGDECLAAVAAYCESCRISRERPDEIPRAVYERLAIPAVELEVPRFGIHDVPIYCTFVEQCDPPMRRFPPGVNARVFGRPPRAVIRKAEEVEGIVIHQTDTEFGVSSRQLERAGGDRALALARRALNVRCHAMSFDGFVAWPNDLRWYVIHGNGFNGATLGLEIEGSFPGLVAQPGDEDTELSPGRLAAARAGVKLLMETGRSLGMPIKYIYAHRQAAANRRSCPGEAIWRQVVLDYAVAELGLEPRRDYVLDGSDGQGLPIPAAWDPEGVGDY